MADQAVLATPGAAPHQRYGYTISHPYIMATTKIILGFFCLIALFGSSSIERHHLNNHDQDAAYQRIVAAAKKEVGTREADVPNTGPKVSAYLRYTGIKTPAAWCAAWVSYVFGQAGYPEPKTAWSPGLFPASRLVREAKPGMVLGIYYPSLKRIGHCGIVESMTGDFVNSIEGNTSNSNEREGDGVMRKLRHRRSIRCYADWVKGQSSREEAANER